MYQRHCHVKHGMNAETVYRRIQEELRRHLASSVVHETHRECPPCTNPDVCKRMVAIGQPTICENEAMPRARPVRAVVDIETYY